MEGHVPTCLNKLFTHFIDTTENVREVREQSNTGGRGGVEHPNQSRLCRHCHSGFGKKFAICIPPH